MRTSLAHYAAQMHIGPEHPVIENPIEAGVFEASIALGVDLFAFADHLTGETDEERAARLDAAADMLMDDPAGLYVGEQAAGIEILPVLAELFDYPLWVDMRAAA